MDISHLSRLDEEKDDFIEEEYCINSNRNSSTQPFVDYSYNDNNIIANNNKDNTNSIIDNKENFNACDIVLTSSSSSSMSLQALLYDLHDSNVKLKSSELQNEHYQQVIKNFNDNEKKLRSENSILVHVMAKKDQDILLLEKKLLQIVSIEYPNTSRSQQLNKEVSIDELRGRLLCSADTKIGELMDALEKTKQVLKEQELQLSEKIVKHKSDKDSLKKELKKMSDQLAQRAALYSAQERRWHDNTRYQDSNNFEKDNELVRLRARLQQLEGQFEKADRERIEGILLQRQYQAEKNILQSQLVDAQERISSIDAELSLASSRNLTLQNTIDRLKGSDIEALERDLTTEVENIKEEARVREAILRRQVDEARAGLSNETDNREKLLDQIVTLRAELDEKNVLLRQVNESGYSTLPNASFSRDFKQDFPSDSRVHNISSSCGESEGSVYSNFDVIVDTHESQDIDNSKFAAMFDLSMSLSEMSVLSDGENRVKAKAKNISISNLGNIASTSSSNSHSTRYDDCSTSNDSFYEEETLNNPSNGVEVGFLLGGNGNSMNSNTPNSTKVNKTFNDTILISQDDEVVNLKNELNSMKLRERYLVKTLKVQGSKLALVLKRASEIGPSQYANSSTNMSISSTTDNKSIVSANDSAQISIELENLKSVVNEKDHTIKMLTIQEEVLKEQLKSYKEEFVLFEEQIKQNKDLGLYEAKEIYQAKVSDFENLILENKSKVEMYEIQITELQQQLSETSEKLKDTNSELKNNNDKLLEELDVTKKELDKARVGYAETELKLKSLENKYELSSSLSSSSLSKVTEQLVSSTQELETIRIELAKTKLELESTRSTIADHEAKLSSTSVSTTSMNDDNKRLTDENIRLHSFVREFVETEKSLNLEIFGLQSENDKLKEAAKNITDNRTYANEDPEYANKIILQVEEYWMDQARELKDEIESLTANLKKTKQDNIKDNERMLATYEELNNKITQHWQREMDKAINDLTLKLTSNTYNKILNQAQYFVGNIENLNAVSENDTGNEDLLINLEMGLRAYISNIKEEMIGLGLEIDSSSNSIFTNDASVSGQDTTIKRLKSEIDVLQKKLAEYDIKAEIKLNIKIEEMKAGYKAKIINLRNKITEKYKRALDSLREEKDKEMNIMVELVRKECEDIFSEANRMIQQERDKKGINGKELMLTPDITKHLVETILGRSASDTELRALFNNHTNNRVEMTPDGKLVVRTDN